MISWRLRCLQSKSSSMTAADQLAGWWCISPQMWIAWHVHAYNIVSFAVLVAVHPLSHAYLYLWLGLRLSLPCSVGSAEHAV